MGRVLKAHHVIGRPRSLCVYVGIPKDHPLVAYGYNNIPLREHWWKIYDDKVWVVKWLKMKSKEPL